MQGDKEPRIPLEEVAARGFILGVVFALGGAFLVTTFYLMIVSVNTSFRSTLLTVVVSIVLIEVIVTALYYWVAKIMEQYLDLLLTPSKIINNRSVYTVLVYSALSFISIALYLWLEFVIGEMPLLQAASNSGVSQVEMVFRIMTDFTLIGLGIMFLCSLLIAGSSLRRLAFSRLDSIKASH